MANFAVGNGPLHIDTPRPGLANVNNPGNGQQARDVLNYDGPNLEKIIPPQLRGDPHRLIAYLCFRLFQDPLTPRDTQPFIQYASDHGPNPGDDALRELLHLMMSTPQYQLT